MHRSVLCALALTVAVAAQSTGSFTAGNLTLNFQGGFTTSVTSVGVPATGGFPVSIESQNNIGSPILLVLGSPGVGSIPLPNNSDGNPQSADLDLFSPFAIVLDGFTPSAVSWFFTIPGSGVFSITAGTLPPPGLETVQAAIASPAAAAGLDLTQALTAATIVPFGSGACSAAGGTNLGAGDDTSHQVTYANGTFTFYGVNYLDCFVNSNGNITFGSGDTDFTASEGEFLSDQPRVAPAWNDWSPNVQGEVRTLEDAFGINIEWFDVPVFGCGQLDTNTFCIRMDYGSGNMFMDFGGMTTCGGTGADFALTGVSPGGGLSGPNNQDISSGLIVGINANDAVYEDFGQFLFSPSFDLGGDFNTQTPTLHCILATGGNGIGPYQIDQL